MCERSTIRFRKSSEERSVSALWQRFVAVGKSGFFNAVLSLMLLMGGAWGATFYVDGANTENGDGSSSRPFNTIAAAVAQVESGRGDVIVVRPGEYRELLALAVGVTLKSECGAAQTFLLGDENTFSTLLELNEGATLQGFSVGDTSGAAVVVNTDCAAALYNCVLFRANSGVQLNPNTSLTCINNTFFENTTGMRLMEGANAAPMRNNIFAYNGTGVLAESGATAASAYNDFFRNTSSVLGVQPDATDLVKEPLFVDMDATPPNLHLRQVSKLHDAGDPDPQYNDKDGSRNDVGADGGPQGALDVFAPQIFVTTTPASAAVALGETITLDAGLSEDAWGIAMWEWDFDALNGVVVEAVGASTSVSYGIAGEYLVTLRVQDNGGITDEALVNVRVGDPPSVEIGVDPQIGATPLPVQFTAQVEEAKQAELTFAWDFDGDGVTESTEQNPAYTFPEGSSPGLHAVDLVVADATGAQTQKRIWVTLTGQAPLVASGIALGEAAQLSVDDTADTLPGARVLFPVNAANQSFVAGVCAVDADALPVLPEGRVLQLLELAPVNLRFALPITVRAPISVSGLREEEIEVWGYEEDAQVWLKENVTRVNLLDGSNPVVLFNTARFSKFAIMGPEEEPGGPCFIATAAYGTPLAEEIQTLRTLRDNVLLTNPMGTAFVDSYYRFSPPIADYIAAHPAAATAIRLLLTSLFALQSAMLWTILASLGGVLLLCRVRV